MKKITSLLLVLLLMFSLSATAFAAGETGYVEYQKKYFLFGPGSVHSDTDLFPELKDVMPGDELTQDITITHKGSYYYNIRVYMRAVGAENANKALVDNMDIFVEHNDDNILYENGDANQNSDWIKLGTIAPRKSTNLTVHLSVDPEMDNEFAEDLGTVVWEFKVEEIPIDNAKTGDQSNITMWAAILVISAAAIVVLLVISKKKKKD